MDWFGRQTWRQLMAYRAADALPDSGEPEFNSVDEAREFLKEREGGYNG